MQRLILCSALVLTAVTAMPVQAGWYNYQHNTHDNLTWKDPNHALSLHSGSGNGVEVTKTNPASVWGLHQGDVILAIDSHPVKHVSELLDRLYASMPNAVNIRLRRGNSEVVLTIAASDYRSIVNPTPPA